MSLYNVVIEVKQPGYEPSQLVTKYDWMNALHGDRIVVIAAHEQQTAPDNGPVDPAKLLKYKQRPDYPPFGIDDVHAPQPSLLTELSIERHDVELADLQGKIAALGERLDKVEHARGDYE